ncbi:hypothetical protein DICSQDRAFT_129768 [Dichomitus squalens LYAD-421 SS1]|uniref:U6 snRNA phosphodiesterase 1 n=1 Tax=Dichomitus squalens (strain LYAD-421) TaxID=732165 RepID=R7SPT8_DICSQ|nr:uncharacterized protein DICSQDRAFT_129768 [Dichomitus squalens LYAD-421 SS1]EJF57002.1 hypothetical protein DICSQDRAFT_129768 [Dichomitus squalens LYAD-421 SS1]
MKRNSSSLVEYGSSDEEGSQTTFVQPSSSAQPLAKKPRKLPALGTHLQPRVPVDNPALHQGRRRTTPHVEGQFAAYVYVPIVIPRVSKLLALLMRIYSAAKRLVPSLQPIGFSDGDALKEPGESSNLEADSIELHISLTRPTYLRAHQREEFKRAVRSAIKAKAKFSASFVTFSELTNDERTRTFLTLEIGAGHDHLKTLVENLTPALRAIRQKEFYEDPRFHASIAWALLDGAKTPIGDTTGEVHLPSTQVVSNRHPGEHGVTSTSNTTDFPTIFQFPPSLIPQLRAEFCHELVQRGVGDFEAQEVHLRIGKEVSKWRLYE